MTKVCFGRIPMGWYRPRVGYPYRFAEAYRAEKVGEKEGLFYHFEQNFTKEIQNGYFEDEKLFTTLTTKDGEEYLLFDCDNSNGYKLYYGTVTETPKEGEPIKVLVAYNPEEEFHPVSQQTGVLDLEVTPTDVGERYEEENAFVMKEGNTIYFVFKRE